MAAVLLVVLVLAGAAGAAPGGYSGGGGPGSAQGDRRSLDGPRPGRALDKVIGPDLMVEWSRRLDDFDRKGWHNITERLSEPQIEYLGLVNREAATEDRVTVRIEAELRDYTVDSNGRRLLRTDDTDEITSLPEYWTLGRRDDGSWFLISIEQDAEGGHVLRQDVVAFPDADAARLHDEAVDTPGAIDDLLYGSDASKRTRLVIRGPVLKSLRITALDAQATPATMTGEAEVSGRRYRENRNTTVVVDGSKDAEITFTEAWTMALDGNDATPWRLAGSSSALV